MPHTYQLQKNRKGRHDPSFQLKRTHIFDNGDNPFAVGTVFPNRDRKITIAFEISRSDVANGMILDMGDTVTGLAIWMDSGTIGFAAGDAVADDGVELTLASALPAIDQKFKFILTVNPGNGKIIAWRDGLIIGRSQAVNTNLPNGWGAAANGAVEAVGTDVTPRVPVGARVALANASVIGKVSIYDGQSPQQI